jgi:ectoine hydroxylase-related dioxygenase (phytanoyl-CoA dioxygenase family)
MITANPAILLIILLCVPCESFTACLSTASGPRTALRIARNEIPSLYMEQEAILVRRGEREGSLMAHVVDPLKANVVKGTGSSGGFGGRKEGGENSQLKVEGKAHADVLKTEGVVRIDNVLSKETADELRIFLYDLRSESEKLVESGDIQPIERFANVLLKENRCDLTVPLGSKIVADSLCSVLQHSPVGHTISNLLGKDAVLYELSCLISDPGSQRQVMHPDTPYLNDDPALYTCFIALQDIQIDMGPTTWLPGTNSMVAHKQFKDEDCSSGESAKDKLLRSTPGVLGTLPKGCCALYDSRTLHCGGANGSNQSRALFYFSFKNPSMGYPGNPGSIRREYISKFRLADLQKEMKAYGRGRKDTVLTL